MRGIAIMLLIVRVIGWTLLAVLVMDWFLRPDSLRGGIALWIGGLLIAIISEWTLARSRRAKSLKVA